MQRRQPTSRARLFFAITWAWFAVAASAPGRAADVASDNPDVGPHEILWVTEGNRLLEIDLRDPTAPPFVRVENAELGGPQGRDVNGMVCAIPDETGRFLAGEDTGQPDTLPGWGVFDRAGAQVAKLAGTYQVPQGEPYGCAFDSHGRLFTSSIGNQGFGAPKGQLFLWFPPWSGYPGAPGAYPKTGASSTRFCKLATDIGTASGVVVDDQDRIYVASAGRGVIERFNGPFPTGPEPAQGCDGVGPVGSPIATQVQRETFFSGWYTFSGMVVAPTGNLFVASVFTGEILELSPTGELIRTLLDPDEWIPPHPTGNPMGLALDSDGNLYYADLDLRWDFPSIGPGPDGKVWRIRFDEAGQAQEPEILLRGLAFPDGVTVLNGRSNPGKP